MAKPQPFKIAVPDDELEWITHRVKTARLVPGKELPADKKWSYGPPEDVAAHLKRYWSTEFDWRKVEAQLNKELQMYTLPISHDGEDLTIHFVHHRATSPDAIPLLFIHGWPGNFLEVRYIIDKLTSPSDPNTQQAFHVVAPSLPGFGLSSYPKGPFDVGQIGTTLHKLMLALGYDRYIVQGGDWGSMLARYIGTAHGPQHCIGVHVNMIIGGMPSPLRAPVTLARLMVAFATGWGMGAYGAKIMQRMMWWRSEESGYQQIQGTKPITVGTALSDSPFGMMLWIRDKLEHLVDDDFVWTDEMVITWAMLYILNGTAGHAEIYKWMLGDGLKRTMQQFAQPVSASVPFGVSVFPKDVLYAPRWWAATTVAHNITFWKEHANGGHFAATEKPDELAEDIREFTRVSKLAVKAKQT